MNTGAKIGIAAAILGAVGVGAAVVFSRRGSGGLGAARFPPKVGQRKSGGMTTKHYRSRKMSIDQRLALLQNLVYEGVHDPSLRKLALQLTSGCQARDGECEARAIDTWMRDNIRYTGDIAPIKIGAKGPVEGIDLFQHPKRTVEFGGGDCLPIETLVLRDDFSLASLIELDPGDVIMGESGWTTVQERWVTGEKDVLDIELSNGCTLRVTAEHRIFRDVGGRTEEIRAGEARVGDDLIVASAVPFASEPQLTWPEKLMLLEPQERAWLLGVYAADGWSDGKVEGSPSRSGISGRDGHPKEEQKRRVVALMEKLQVHTRWHEKYVSINDSSIAGFFSKTGRRAYDKSLPWLACVDEGEARALIEGLAADADVRDRVFGTTSRALALQLRVLHRMLGISVGIRRVDDHGGFGQHPIYRVTPRRIDNERRDVRFARIRAIRDGGTALCADITTDQGKFWLPESDVVVHNCDDHSTLAATLLALNGISSKFRVTASKYGGGWSHIYVVAGLPKENPSKWVAVDTTLPGRFYGTEASYAMKKDFNALAFVKEAVT